MLRLLNKRYGDLYTESNFILSATHTHGTPGGHLMDLLFDIPSYGFVKEVFDALTSGILKVSEKLGARIFRFQFLLKILLQKALKKVNVPKYLLFCVVQVPIPFFFSQL